MSKLKKDDKIFIAGHNGMVGSAIERKFIQEGFKNILTFSSKELDLRDQLSVDEFYKKEKPDFVILAAAKVGGIHANNKYKAEFIYDNLMIETNVIHSAYLNNVKKLAKFSDTPAAFMEAHRKALRDISNEIMFSGQTATTFKRYLSNTDGKNILKQIYPRLKEDIDTLAKIQRNSEAGGTVGMFAMRLMTTGVAGFYGETMSGTWTLIIDDHISGTAGTLIKWGIEIYGN